MSHRVAVVIPFFNEEEHLAEAIESVISQSYQNWELVLVDDGSEDASPSIAAGYESTDSPRIKVVSHAGGANRKLAASRNLGIAQSTAPLVAFLDADDVWLPQKLKEQVEVFDKSPEVDLLFGSSTYWSSWAGGEDRYVSPANTTGQGCFRPPSLIPLIYPVGSGSAPTPSGIMARREALARIGGFAEDFVRSHRDQAYEDQAFLAKAYLDLTVWVDNRTWDRYRIRSGSLSNQLAASGQYRELRRYFFDWLSDQIRGEYKGRIDLKLQLLIEFRRFQAGDSFPVRLARGVKVLVRRLGFV